MIRYVWIGGELHSRLWYFRLWKRVHNLRCRECRGAA